MQAEDAAQPPRRPNKASLRSFLALQSNKTRRLHGRRSITPIRHKHQTAPAKTRSASKTGARHVSVHKRAGAQHNAVKREDTDQTELRQHQGEQGHQDSDLDGKRQDTEVHPQTVAPGNQPDSAESVYPGTVQAVHGLPEQTADIIAFDETLPEEEERSTP